MLKHQQRNGTFFSARIKLIIKRMHGWSTVRLNYRNTKLLDLRNSILARPSLLREVLWYFRRRMPTVLVAFCATSLFANDAIVLDQTRYDELQNLIEVGETELVIAQAVAMVASIEKDYGYHSPELVKPLLLLGDSEFAESDFVGALDSWQRARQISRESTGLFGTDQIDILYREADALFELRRYSQANDLHEQAFAIHQQVFETDSAELLPGLQELADWYLQSLNVFAARGLYKLALKIIDDEISEEDQDQLRIPVLRQLALTYRYERFPPPSDHSSIPILASSLEHIQTGYKKFEPDVNTFAPGEVALIDAINLMDQNPDKHPDLAQAFLELADWYLLFDRKSRASVVYAEVWRRFGLQDPAFIDAEMSVPKALYFPVSGGQEHLEVDQEALLHPGKIEVSLTVQPNGSTLDARIIHADPVNKLDDQMLSAAAQSKFRPAFIDGVPQTTESVRYRHRFRYVASDDI